MWGHKKISDMIYINKMHHLKVANIWKNVLLKIKPLQFTLDLMPAHNPCVPSTKPICFSGCVQEQGTYMPCLWISAFHKQASGFTSWFSSPLLHHCHREKFWILVGTRPQKSFSSGIYFCKQSASVHLYFPSICAVLLALHHPSVPSLVIEVCTLVQK